MHDLLVGMLYHNIINVVSMLFDVTMFIDMVFFLFHYQGTGKFTVGVSHCHKSVPNACMRCKIFGLLYLVLNSSSIEISLIC